MTRSCRVVWSMTNYIACALRLSQASVLCVGYKRAHIFSGKPPRWCRRPRRSRGPVWRLRPASRPRRSQSRCCIGSVRMPRATSGHTLVLRFFPLTKQKSDEYVVYILSAVFQFARYFKIHFNTLVRQLAE